MPDVFIEKYQHNEECQAGQGLAARGPGTATKNPVMATMGSGEVESELSACRLMAPGDINRVVEIHLASFPGFFLTFLGRRFLREFYRGTLNDPASLALVAVDRPGRIAGFVAGQVEPSGFYKRLLMRRGWAFAVASIGPVFRKPSIIPRLFRAMNYRGGSPATPGGALLVSLAVHPEMQALGAGKLLVRRFAEECFRRGAAYIYLVTDREHNDAVNRFYQSLGWKIETEMATPEGRALNLYTYFRPADGVGQSCEEFSSVSDQSTALKHACEAEKRTRLPGQTSK